MTPIADLMTFLLSRGLSPGDIAEAIRIVEAAIARNATHRASPEETREKWRLKKAAQREKKTKMSPGTPELYIESSSISKDKDSLKKERKKDSACPPVSGDIEDGWPVDYEKQFWENFPKKRRYDKPQVMAFLAKLRREKTVAWAVLFDGVLRYAASDHGDYGAKAPLPWLRGHRWEGDYGKQILTGASNGEQSNRRNGGTSDPIIAAARRRGGAMRGDGQASGREDAIPPSGRMDDGRGAPRGSEEPTLDLDIAPRPGGRFS